MPAERFADVPKIYYRIVEAKHATGLSVDTLKRMIRTGELRSFKVRGSRLISASEIESLEKLAA